MSDDLPLWKRPVEEQIAHRLPIVRKYGAGWTVTGHLPNDRYRVMKTQDGWDILTYDEQQAGWDTDHNLH